MNRITATIAFVIAAFSAAASAQTGLAGDISVETQPFISSKSRVEVRAELDAYKKAGVNPWSRSYNPLAHFKSMRTSEDVQAEYIANRDAVSALNGEDSGSTFLATGAAAMQPSPRMAGAAGGEVRQ